MKQSLDDWQSLLDEMERNPPYERGLWRLKKFLPNRPPSRSRTMIDFGYRWEFYLTHPHEWFFDLYREIRRCIHRGIYGYADVDVWNLTNYLIVWLPDALRQLAEEENGCPQDLFDKGCAGDECHKWRDLLIEMAEGFEFYREYDRTHWEAPIEQEQELFEEAHKRVAKSLLLMAQWYPNLWD